MEGKVKNNYEIVSSDIYIVANTLGAQLNNFIEYWQDDLDMVTANISSNQESEFVKYHDAHDFGVLACNCFIYSFQIPPTSSLYSKT